MCPEKLEDSKEVSISRKGQRTQWSKEKGKQWFEV